MKTESELNSFEFDPLAFPEKKEKTKIKTK